MKPRKPGFLKVILQWLCVVALVAIGWFAVSPTQHKPTQKQSVSVKVEDMVHQDVPIPPDLPNYEESPIVPPAEIGGGMPEPIVPPLTQHSARPKIAIVIDDVGLDVRGSQRATALPSHITLSFLPYAHHLRDQTKTARDQGHELMLHMPMEPVGHDNPGPNALLVSLSPQEIRQRTQTMLASFAGYDGVNNHMGSKFTADKQGMEIVLDEIKGRGLFFLDSRTSPKTVASTLAKEHAVPTLARDVFLDDNENAEVVRLQLMQTEHIASRKGHAIAIGHPHTVTLEELEKWIPQAEARGFEFVPVRDLISQP